MLAEVFASCLGSGYRAKFVEYPTSDLRPKKNMDGYLYHGQLARMKFRLFHLLLEICKYRHQILRMICVGT